MSKKKKTIVNPNIGLIKDTSSPEADAIMRLQANIDFVSKDKKMTCYAVTSAKESEGKTTTAGNLAKMYAEKGLKVVLVDFDLRKPAVHKLFHIENQSGVVEYVQGAVKSLEEIIHNVDGVDIITAGASVPFPAKILVSEKIRQMITELKNKYDYVLMDVSPIMVTADAFSIGHDIDGFLLVCAQQVSRKKDVAAAVEAIAEKRINIIGIAIDMTDPLGGENDF